MDKYNDEEIKDAAFKKLNDLSESELQDINEIDIEVHLPNADGSPERYTVFFERGFVGGKDSWSVRHIIRPDKLERPEQKEDGKIE